MKKLYGILVPVFILLLSVMLSGCGNEVNSVDKDKTEITEKPENSDKAEATDITEAGDKAEAADITEAGDKTEAADITEAGDKAEASDITEAGDKAEASEKAGLTDTEAGQDEITGMTVAEEILLSRPDSKAVNLEIVLGDEHFGDNVDYFKIWLSDSLKHCSIVINDPKKKYFSMNPQISVSYSIEEALPYEDFLALLDSYGYFELNEKGEKKEGSMENISIRISFENGQQYSFTSGVLPEKYEEFKKEYVTLLTSTYRAIAN